MEDLHEVLARQLAAHGLDPGAPPPTPAAWRAFLDGVSRALAEAPGREHAEQALRDANRFLDSIVENIPDMIFVKEADSLRFVRFNRAGEELLGRSRDDLIGKSDFDFFPEEQARFFVEKDRAVLAQRSVLLIPEEPIETATHGRRLLQTKKIPILDESGTPRYLLGISRDITDARRAEADALRAAALEREVSEHRRTERRLATQSAAARVLAAAPTVTDAATRLLQAICEGLGWAAGGFWRPSLDGRSLACEAFWRRPGGALAAFEAESRSRPLGPDQGLPGRVWQTASAVWLQDVTREPNFPRAASAREAGLFAGAAFPIVVGSRCLGVLELFSHAPEPRDEQLVLMLTGVGALFGQFLERRRAEEDLVLSEARFRRLFDANIVGLFVSGLDGSIREANDLFLRMVGYTRQDLAEGRVRWDAMTPPEHRASSDAASAQIRAAGIAGPWEKEYVRKDGSRVPVIIGVAAMPGGAAETIAFALDITERKRMEAAHARLEDQLRQSQKMEAIGRLAGGVAHDFNNMLAAIIGYADLVLAGMRPADPARHDLEQILRASERAAQLTRQLLIFSRKQVLEPKLVDLNAVVRGVLPMLQRLIGADMEPRLELCQGIAVVLADAGQLEQVIMNLVVNARDAMPRGGTLGVETERVEVDEALARRDGIRPGPYVLLTVSDTGAGMSADVQSHLFEPFFTTKPTGKGTGLGLSTTFGIVKQAGGHIAVESEVGRGSRFRIYLPFSALPPDVAATAPSGKGTLRGTETVLLVEDEELVREITARLLRARGYRVLEARDGQDALALFELSDTAIDLLLTDVVMPRMNGRELYERVARLHPGVKVLFLSGYSAGALADSEWTQRPGVGVLTKPFSAETLARMVRETLDAQ